MSDLLESKRKAQRLMLEGGKLEKRTGGSPPTRGHVVDLRQIEVATQPRPHKERGERLLTVCKGVTTSVVDG